MPSDEDQIKEVLNSINRAWLSKEYHAIGAHLAENVVLAAPDSSHRLIGPAAYVQSYRDYDAAAVTIAFESGTPQIDVVGDVAVALCPFHIVYELAGTEYREEGHDMLVMSRRSGKWVVGWRSMRTSPAK